MKKIVLFTWLTPTEDNYNGPSALSYHIMKNRPQEYELIIYSINGNHVRNDVITKTAIELRAEIKTIKDTIYNYFHKRYILADFRLKIGIDKSYGISNYKLPSKYLKEINHYNPDLIIIFDENFSTVARQLSNFKLLIWGYDCFPLHYHRLMYDSYCFKDIQLYTKILKEYKISIFRELEYNNIPCKIAEVGIEDVYYYKTITQRNNVKFYPHPHYKVYHKEINLNNKKLSILISGKYDVYTYTDINNLIIELDTNSLTLKEKFKFTFIGKTWQPIIDKLLSLGYEVKNIKWAEIYAKEVIKHDLQIFPISVGSGTKGKVLDALSMGLLCIGSKIALENIYVKDRHSCFQYKNIKEIPKILNFIYENKQTAMKIAENGRQQILKWHNPKRIAQLMLDDILTNDNFEGEEEYYNVINNLKPIL